MGGICGNLGTSETYYRAYLHATHHKHQSQRHPWQYHNVIHKGLPQIYCHHIQQGNELTPTPR